MPIYSDIPRKKNWVSRGLDQTRRMITAMPKQKNWTHVKKFVGYLRYDTEEEKEILNALYQNELRLYKNFFQPAVKTHL